MDWNAVNSSILFISTLQDPEVASKLNLVWRIFHRILLRDQIKGRLEIKDTIQKMPEIKMVCTRTHFSRMPNAHLSDSTDYTVNKFLRVWGTRTLYEEPRALYGDLPFTSFKDRQTRLKT